MFRKRFFPLARKRPLESIKPRFDGDFTVWTKFKTTDGGTIFANCAPRGRWSPGAKALLVRGQRLVYDIGWVGDIEGGARSERREGKNRPPTLKGQESGALPERQTRGFPQELFKTRPDKPRLSRSPRGRTTSPPRSRTESVRDLKYWTGALPDLVFSDIVSEAPGKRIPSE